MSWIRAHKSLSKCHDELQSRPKGKGPRATDPASGIEASADEAGEDEPQVSPLRKKARRKRAVSGSCACRGMASLDTRTCASGYPATVS